MRALGERFGEQRAEQRNASELEAALRRATFHYCGSLGLHIAGGALGDQDFVRFQALCLPYVAKRLREAGHARKAVLLRPFS